jgi:hypothetical protein
LFQAGCDVAPRSRRPTFPGGSGSARRIAALLADSSLQTVPAAALPPSTLTVARRIPCPRTGRAGRHLGDGEFRQVLRMRTCRRGGLAPGPSRVRNDASGGSSIGRQAWRGPRAVVRRPQLGSCPERPNQLAFTARDGVGHNRTPSPTWRTAPLPRRPPPGRIAELTRPEATPLSRSLLGARLAGVAGAASPDSASLGGPAARVTMAACERRPPLRPRADGGLSGRRAQERSGSVQCLPCLPGRRHLRTEQ